jgi:hypothetical protein
MRLYLTCASMEWLGTKLLVFGCFASLIWAYSRVWVLGVVRWSSHDLRILALLYISHAPQSTGLAWEYSSYNTAEVPRERVWRPSSPMELVYCPFYPTQLAKTVHMANPKSRDSETQSVPFHERSCKVTWHAWLRGDVKTWANHEIYIPVFWIESKEGVWPKHVTWQIVVWFVYLL